MIQEISKLYFDLTQAQIISIKIMDRDMSITIVSKWFELQSKEERMEYLLEGLEVCYPEMKLMFNISFLPYTPDEARALKSIRLAS